MEWVGSYLGTKLTLFQIGSHLPFAKISLMLRERSLAVAEIPKVDFPGES